MYPGWGRISQRPIGHCIHTATRARVWWFLVLFFSLSLSWFICYVLDNIDTAWHGYHILPLTRTTTCDCLGSRSYVRCGTVRALANIQKPANGKLPGGYTEKTKYRSGRKKKEKKSLAAWKLFYFVFFFIIFFLSLLYHYHFILHVCCCHFCSAFVIYICLLFFLWRWWYDIGFCTLHMLFTGNMLQANRLVYSLECGCIRL